MGLCRLQSTHQFETNNRLQLQQPRQQVRWKPPSGCMVQQAATEEPPHTCPLGPARQDLIARTGLQDRPAGPANIPDIHRITERTATFRLLLTVYFKSRRSLRLHVLYMCCFAAINFVSAGSSCSEASFRGAGGPSPPQGKKKEKKRKKERKKEKRERKEKKERREL